MEFRMLTVGEVKKTINKNKIKFREFFIDKTVYGFVNLDEVVAMVGISENKQLVGAKKIYHPFFNPRDHTLGKKLIQNVVSAIENEGTCTVIYADCLKDAKDVFVDAGFKITTSKTDLKRYETLWRAVYYGNLFD